MSITAYFHSRKGGFPPPSCASHNSPTPSGVLLWVFLSSWPGSISSLFLFRLLFFVLRFLFQGFFFVVQPSSFPGVFSSPSGFLSGFFFLSFSLILFPAFFLSFGSCLCSSSCRLAWFHPSVFMSFGSFPGFLLLPSLVSSPA